MGSTGIQGTRSASATIASVHGFGNHPPSLLWIAAKTVSTGARGSM